MFALVLVAEGDARRGWLLAGALLGLGLENKHTMILPGVALAIGLLATPLRSGLRTPTRGCATAKNGVPSPGLVPFEPCLATLRPAR